MRYDTMRCDRGV